MLTFSNVPFVDLFGQKEGGTIVGDNLFYYIMKATKGAGLVVDGSIRDLEGISRMDMPAYFRHAHPTAIGNVIISGINIPVRIGNATVMPGDLVFGDAEGVYFIPPALVEAVVDNADIIHIHDEWTRMKFDEGRYQVARHLRHAEGSRARKGIRRVPQEASRRATPGSAREVGKACTRSSDSHHCRADACLGRLRAGGGHPRRPAGTASSRATSSR